MAALYLPGGLLMPARLVSLGLLVLGVLGWRWEGPNWALRWVVLIAATWLGGAMIGALRFGGSTWVDWAHLSSVLIPVVALALIPQEYSAKALVLGWLVAGTISSAIGTFEWITGHHLPGTFLSVKWSEEYHEIASVFDNPNLFSYQLAVIIMLVPLAVRLWPRWTILFAALSALDVVLLWLTSGRMALLVCIFGMGLWAVYSRRGRYLGGAAAILFGIVVICVRRVGDTVLVFVSSIAGQVDLVGSSTWIRVRLIGTTGWLLGQTSYMGGGPGAFERMANDIENPYRVDSVVNAHWGLAEVAVNLGLASLVVLLAALGCLSVLGFSTWWRARGVAGPKAVFGYACLVLAVTVPMLSMAHSTWIRQPLTGAHLGLLVVLSLCCLPGPTWAVRNRFRTSRRVRRTNEPASPTAT